MCQVLSAEIRHSSYLWGVKKLDNQAHGNFFFFKVMQPVCMLSLQSCLTLFDPMDYSPLGSSVHEILQARLLEWVALASFRLSSRPRDWTHVSCVSCIGRRVLYHCCYLGSPQCSLLLSHFSHVWLCATPSLGFSRQEHMSGLPFPSPVHKIEKWKWSRLVMSDSSQPHTLQPTRLLRPWDFPGKSTGVECHGLLR